MSSFIVNPNKPKNKNFNAIVYHGQSCSDGTCSLWCAKQFSEINNCYPCDAGKDPIAKFDDLNVLFVDLCPSYDYLVDLVKKAKSVTILDHHKSSEQICFTNL